MLVKLNRINQILSWMRISSNLLDAMKLTILGFARGHTFNSSDLISRIGRNFFPTLIVQSRFLNKIKIELNPSDLGHLISFQEVILENCYDLKLLPFNPELILDCGAHIGLFSILAAHTYPTSKIISFEPNPKNINCIRRQLEINSLPISLIESAVSTQEGESWFQSEYSNTGTLLKHLDKPANSYLVKTLDLPRLIGNLNISTLLLKLDIEGEENLLLPKLIPQLPPKCAIFFESHHGETGWLEIQQLLTMANFQVQQIRCRYPYADGFALRN